MAASTAAFSLAALPDEVLVSVFGCLSLEERCVCAWQGFRGRHSLGPARFWVGRALWRCAQPPPAARRHGQTSVSPHFLQAPQASAGVPAVLAAGEQPAAASQHVI